MLSLKQLGSGFAASGANPFAGLDERHSRSQQGQQARKKGGSNAPVAAASAGVSSAALAAAAERKRQKNREKRLRKKKAANGGAANGNANDDDDEEEDDDEDDASASGTPPHPPASSLRVRPSALSMSEESEHESGHAQPVHRVPTPRVTPSAGPPSRTNKDQLAIAPAVDEDSTGEEEEEEEDEDDDDDDEEEDEDEEDAESESESESEAESSEAESASAASSDSASSESEDDEATDEYIDSQVVSLGYDRSLVAAARGQLEQSGIPVDTEMLLLAVQQEDALAKERASGKHTVFKKPQQQQQQQTKKTTHAATAAVAAETPAAAAAATPAPAAKSAPAAQPVRQTRPPLKASQAAKSSPPVQVAPATPSPASPSAVVASSAAVVPASVAAAATTTSRGDHSVRGLESLAKAWSPLSDLVGATSLLAEWSDLLERANAATKLAAHRAATTDATPDSSFSFAQSFAESGALEHLVRTLLTSFFVPGVVEASKQRSLDRPLLRLFAAALTGRPEDHRFLLQQIGALARVLATASEDTRPKLVDKVLKVVAAQRRVAAVHLQIASVIGDAKSRTSSSSRTPAPDAESRALDDLRTHGLDAQTFFGGDANAAAAASSQVRTMWLAAHASQTGLAQGETLLARFGGILTQSPSHALQLTFHLLEREVQDASAASTRALDSHAQQVAQVASQIATLDANKVKELGGLTTLSQEQTSREQDLLKRRATLMAELEQIDAGLAALKTSREKTNASNDAIEAKYALNRTKLDQLATNAKSRDVALRGDVRAASEIHSLVISVYDRLTTSNNAALQGLVNANVAAVTTYIDGVGRTIADQAKLVVFLESRARFCAKKLDSLAAERADALRYGVGLGAQEVERSFAATLKQDEKAVTLLRTRANQLLKKVAKLVVVGVPPAQLHTIYSKLLTIDTPATADKDSSDAQFDFAPVRNLLAHLEQAATTQTPKSPPIAAVAVPTTVAAAPITTVSQAPTPARSAVTPQQTNGAPVPVVASASPLAVAPSTAPLDALANGGKPQRLSFAARRKEKEAARAARSPQAAPPHKSNGVVHKTSSAANKVNGIVVPPPTEPTTPATAVTSPAGVVTTTRPSPTPSPPVRTWSTQSVSQSPPAAAANDAAFPALSAANLQKAKEEEKQQQASITAAAAVARHAANGYNTQQEEAKQQD